MLSIRLKPALERRLSRLARQTGRTKTFYATKLIEENIEDLEDRYLAEARLENRGKRYSTAEKMREALLNGAQTEVWGARECADFLRKDFGERRGEARGHLCCPALV